MKRADAEAIQIRPAESGEGRPAEIKRAAAEAIQITGPRREERLYQIKRADAKGYSYTDQGRQRRERMQKLYRSRARRGRRRATIKRADA